MSKMDALRKMREARYEQAAARAKQAGTPARRATAPVAPPATTRTDVVEVDAEADSGERLCGHRNMSGRTCTREHGHSAKSHRYS
ncbi:MAG: hypothetical protein WB767_16000 [Nocardioides sp.]